MIHVCLVFFSGEFPHEDLLWYKEKQTLGKAFLEQSKTYSSFAAGLIAETYSSSRLEEQLDTMRMKILNNTALPPSVLSGTMWFDNMTDYINILKSVQDNLAHEIVKVRTSAQNLLKS